jgi:hypothetical protein
LVRLELRPYRELATPEALKAALHGVDRLLMAATERAYHRSQDDAKQREHYSGKKLGRQNQLEKVCFQCREIGSWITAKAPPLWALVAASLQSVA